MASVSKGNRRQILRWLVIASVLMVALSACAAGPNPGVDVPSVDGELAGFLSGLWHGIIVPVTFMISLFTENVSIYEVHNTGGWYDFGFLLGAGMFLGGGGAGAKSARR